MTLCRFSFVQLAQQLLPQLDYTIYTDMELQLARAAQGHDRQGAMSHDA